MIAFDLLAMTASPADALLVAGGSAPERFRDAAELLLIMIVDLGILAIGCAILMCLWRVLRGPTLVDRGIAADTVAVQVAGFVILLTVRFETLALFDAVLIVSILGFVSTIAFAQYVGRRRSVV